MIAGSIRGNCSLPHSAFVTRYGVPCASELGRRAALSAVAMTIAPGDQRTRIGKDAGFIAIQRSDDRAQILEFGAAEYGWCLSIVEGQGKTRALAKNPQKRRIPQVRLQCDEQLIPPFDQLSVQPAGRAQHQVTCAPHRYEQRTGIVGCGGEPVAVLAVLCGALDVRAGQHIDARGAGGHARAVYHRCPLLPVEQIRQPRAWPATNNDRRRPARANTPDTIPPHPVSPYAGGAP